MPRQSHACATFGPRATARPRSADAWVLRRTPLSARRTALGSHRDRVRSGVGKRVDPRKSQSQGRKATSPCCHQRRPLLYAPGKPPRSPSLLQRSPSAEKNGACRHQRRPVPPAAAQRIATCVGQLRGRAVGRSVNLENAVFASVKQRRCQASPTAPSTQELPT